MTLKLTLDHMLLTDPLQSIFQTGLSTFLFLHEKSRGPEWEPIAENSWQSWNWILSVLSPDSKLFSTAPHCPLGAALFRALQG